MNLTAGSDDNDRRLDRILRKALPDMPLSAIHRLLREGQVLVNGKRAKAETRVFQNDVIAINNEQREGIRDQGSGSRFPGKQTKHISNTQSLVTTKPVTCYLLPVVCSPLPSPQSLVPLILYESQGLLVFNKPAGLAAHGGKDSLEKRVQVYLKDKLSPSLSFKPGPLHRLDKPTSGIVVFGTTLEASRRFAALLAQGKIRKRYLAILQGTLTKEQVWQDTLYRDKTIKKTFVQNNQQKEQEGMVHRNQFSINLPRSTRRNTEEEMVLDKSKSALTRVKPLSWARKGKVEFTLAELEIKTGRTHQIRAQAAAHGHPLAGDRKYGGHTLLGPRFFLHAAELECGEWIPLIKAPLPKAFSLLAKELFGF